jgi:DNA-binding NarL/FixJ family response regulator
MKAHMPHIRIAVFDDSEDQRLSFKYLIGMQSDMSLVGIFENAVNAIETLRRCKPDIILMDIEMPGISGIEAVRQIKEKMPNAVILMQTIFDEDSTIFDAIKAGASGYLLKKSSPVKIIDSIREAYEGGAPMSPAIASKVLRFFRESDKLDKDSSEKAPKLYDLTSRELEILAELVNGNSYKMVSANLNITYNTVNTHVRHIYEKLHVHSIGEAVAKAIKERLI